MATVKTPLFIGRNVTYNTPSEVAVGETNVADSSLGWDPNVRYSYALLQNTGATNLFLKYGTDAATTSVYHTKLAPGTQVDLSNTIGGSLNIISSGSGGKDVFTLASPNTSTT